MIGQRCFAVEPWALRETELQLDLLAQSESVFALGNGHIGLRGNLDEGEPAGLPGTYLNGLYEGHPLPYAEAGFGYPEAGQQVVNVTNGKLIRVLVDDEPFDLRYGTLHSHERVLDFRSGTLHRSVEWSSPTGKTVRIRSTRLVSLAQRAVAAIRFEIEPVSESTRIVLQSELVANEPPPEGDAADPRDATGLDAPLVAEQASAGEAGALLVHVTRSSGLRVAAGMEHIVEGPEGTATDVEASGDLARLAVTTDLAPGESLCLTKFIAYGWSSQRSLAAVRDQVDGALTEARHTGWEGLLGSQRGALDDFWENADVEIDGDAELQQAVRFGMFHVMQASARAEGRAIPAKGLTGSGYDGHAFWDTETFVLPLLTYTVPEAAANALRWRHSTIGLACERASLLGLEGAAFPWRTIAGEECSGYWPAGTAAFHVGADIAAATSRYIAATGDEEFAAEAGIEILVETARLWRSLGHHDQHGRFRIDGVTGPDEYSALADNNLYTNLMAQANLRDACAAVESHPRIAARLDVDLEEAASWRDAADRIVVPYDEELGVHEQAEGFTSLAIWDFASMSADDYPLFLNHPYFQIYRQQVVKQADLALAMHLRGDEFSAAEKARNFSYYEPLTVRDSSLSACTQSVVAAEVGHLQLAHDYMAEAAMMDLTDSEHNTRDGVHMASLAGAWIAAVAGFGGFRDHGGELSFAPRLPPALSRIVFRLRIAGRRIEVEIGPKRARYVLLDDGSTLRISHHGEALELRSGSPVELPIGAAPQLEPPEQPPGRAPLPRRPGPSAGPRPPSRG